MRTMTLTLILACAAILSNVSIAGSTSNVPNAGLFASGLSSALAVASR